jgi:hypothetical protein
VQNPVVRRERNEGAERFDREERLPKYGDRYGGHTPADKPTTALRTSTNGSAGFTGHVAPSHGLLHDVSSVPQLIDHSLGVPFSWQLTSMLVYILANDASMHCQAVAGRRVRRLCRWHAERTDEKGALAAKLFVRLSGSESGG